MKSSYDYKPQIIESNCNNTWRYHQNIKQVTFHDYSSETDITMFECDFYTIKAPLTSDNIKRTVVTTILDQDGQEKLINEYNSVSLGLITGDRATTITNRYNEFLSRRIEILNQIDIDCKTLNIL